MKKLVIACCIVLTIGGCMMAAGWAAGGQLYGSYYGGQLHPVSETVRDATDFVSGHLQYRSWRDADGWHSGWFDNWVDDTVDKAVDDTLNSIDTDWVDGWLEKRREAIDQTDQAYFVPYIGIDTVQNLDFTFVSDAETDEQDTIYITFGRNYDISGAEVLISKMNGYTWSLQLRPYGAEDCVITLPSSSSDALDSITLNIGNHRVEIDGSLTAQNFHIDIQDGTLIADSLNAGQFDLSIDGGRFAPNAFCVSSQMDVELGSGSIASTIVTPGDGSDLGYQVSTAGGVFLLDGQAVAGGDSGVAHASRKGELSGSPILRAEIGSGTLDLLTRS